MKIWRTNHFDIPASIKASHRLYKDRPDLLTCVYAKVSYVNHDCDGNTGYSFTKELDIVFVAIRDISVGEEITHSYFGHRFMNLCRSAEGTHS
jgi:hypothetical protein